MYLTLLRLAFLKDKGKSIIKSKMIWKHVKREGQVSLFTFNVSNKDRDFLTWLGRNNVHHFPIISSKECPKQDPSSVDSGIAVTYIIKRLSEGLELESTFKKGAMTQQRAHVLGRFLSDNNDG
ncbi:uncharacterized protein LOC133727834 [Rosa rugosa]|uniref:uncharacterized protein LOC133718091 n=1 Tax=Rosa rugosa TaxID=74645 RepID=UPI002B413CA4|nr:uncharacterized protein LOC133718091 [Rosa rugosa]XP_062011217.1 uncharacterized protein LOC133727834 [Rosa rugosa]